MVSLIDLLIHQFLFETGFEFTWNSSDLGKCDDDFRKSGTSSRKFDVKCSWDGSFGKLDGTSGRFDDGLGKFVSTFDKYVVSSCISDDGTGKSVGNSDKFASSSDESNGSTGNSVGCSGNSDGSSGKSNESSEKGSSDECKFKTSKCDGNLDKPTGWSLKSLFSKSDLWHLFDDLDIWPCTDIKIFSNFTQIFVNCFISTGACGFKN